MFDGRQLDPFIVQPCQAEGKAQPVDGKFEVRIGWGVMPLLAEIKIIVDLVEVQFGRQLIEMKGDMR